GFKELWRRESPSCSSHAHSFVKRHNENGRTVGRCWKLWSDHSRLGERFSSAAPAVSLYMSPTNAPGFALPPCRGRRYAQKRSRRPPSPDRTDDHLNLNLPGAVAITSMVVLAPAVPRTNQAPLRCRLLAAHCCTTAGRRRQSARQTIQPPPRKSSRRGRSCR